LIHIVWHRAEDHSDWNSLVKTAVLHAGACYWWWWWLWCL